MLGSPSPTAITGNESEQEKPTRGWQSPLLRCPFETPLGLASDEVPGSQT